MPHTDLEWSLVFLSFLKGKTEKDEEDEHSSQTSGNLPVFNTLWFI